MDQAQVAERPIGADAQEMDVRFVSGESYEMSVRGHRYWWISQRTQVGRTPRLPPPSCLLCRWQHA